MAPGARDCPARRKLTLQIDAGFRDTDGPDFYVGWPVQRKFFLRTGRANLERELQAELHHAAAS
jgi:hypothetical protein